MTATFETINATHILICCPRGFANERACYAIPADCVADARRRVEMDNPHRDVYLTQLIDIADADPRDRSSAGKQLWGSPEDYKIGLYTDGPLCGMLEF